ncbi:MAG: hypothetical protein HYR63_12970 [Proteobacteria bacterium]|nr:hypothetical protein [Pseudomonadota bacterium]MBI3496992.1 hypothetical protein [Pseudomonadota bacterium]
MVIETFIYLYHNANRDVVLTWKDSIYEPGIVKILPSDHGAFEGEVSFHDGDDAQFKAWQQSIPRDAV